jgi:hypothetical protein
MNWHLHVILVSAAQGKKKKKKSDTYLLRPAKHLVLGHTADGLRIAKSVTIVEDP